METRVNALEQTASEVRERLAKIEATLVHVATTASLERLAGDMKTSFEALGAKLESQNTKIESQKTRIESVKSELIKWFVTTSAILIGLAFTAAKMGG